MEKIQKWTDGLDKENMSSENMSSELQKIFSEAVEFSKLIRMQRANWSVRFPLYSSGVSKRGLMPEQNLTSSSPVIQSRSILQSANWRTDGDESLENGKGPLLWFNCDTMKSVQPDDEEERTDNKIVQIFVSPALFKRGDADGYNFDIVSVIEPSVVLWAEAPPVHQSAPKPSAVSQEQVNQRSMATEPPIQFHTQDHQRKLVKPQQMGNRATR